MPTIALLTLNGHNYDVRLLTKVLSCPSDGTVSRSILWPAMDNSRTDGYTYR